MAASAPCGSSGSAQGAHREARGGPRPAEPVWSSLLLAAAAVTAAAAGAWWHPADAAGRAGGGARRGAVPIITPPGAADRRGGAGLPHRAGHAGHRAGRPPADARRTRARLRRYRYLPGVSRRAPADPSRTQPPRNSAAAPAPRVTSEAGTRRRFAAYVPVTPHPETGHVPAVPRRGRQAHGRDACRAPIPTRVCRQCHGAAAPPRRRSRR